MKLIYSFNYSTNWKEMSACTHWQQLQLNLAKRQFFYFTPPPFRGGFCGVYTKMITWCIWGISLLMFWSSSTTNVFEYIWYYLNKYKRNDVINRALNCSYKKWSWKTNIMVVIVCYVYIGSVIKCLKCKTRHVKLFQQSRREYM